MNNVTLTGNESNQFEAVRKIIVTAAKQARINNNVELAECLKKAAFDLIVTEMCAAEALTGDEFGFLMSE